jgi:hypothetical protein
MGRRLIHDTPEKQARARKVARANSKAKTKNITVDADMVEQINAVCDQLKGELGFRPSISQAIRYLINKSMRREA